MDEVICANAGSDDGSTWITSDGEYIDIEDLSDDHLVNIIKKIRRHDDESRFNQYDNLVTELKTRKLDMTKHPSNKLEPLRGKIGDIMEVNRREYDVMSGFTKDDIKSAVEFYKRYRDNIDKLFEYEKKVYNKWFRYIETKLQTDTPVRQIKVMYVYYNDWLFDYCFSDVTYARN